jgi:two-component sensor histidine kinase
MLLCPISGRKLDRRGPGWQIGRVSIRVDDVQQRLQTVLGLSRTQAMRAVDEVLDSLGLEVDEYIARRHAELQSEGWNNAEIFERIAEELRLLRFKAPELSARQIRRRIYG